MRIDIASNNHVYKGMERPIGVGDFKKEFLVQLLPDYLKYIELTCPPIKTEKMTESSKSSLVEELIVLYQKFKEYGVNCELIVYNAEPLSAVFDDCVELYGIDVVCEMCESMLEVQGHIHRKVKEILNPYGLCRDIQGVDMVLKYERCGNVSWEPCWVYRVKDECLNIISRMGEEHE